MSRTTRDGGLTGPNGDESFDVAADPADLLRSAFEMSLVGMAVLDSNGRLRAVNHELAALLDDPASELMTVSSADMTHPDDAAARDRELVARIRTSSLADRLPATGASDPTGRRSGHG